MKNRNGSHTATVDSHRVLMIAPTSFFADYGCHVRILEHARGLVNRGHKITLCTYHSGSDIAGLNIYRTPNIPWRKGAEVGSSWHKLLLDVFLLFLVFRVAMRTRPDTLHAYLHEGALIGIIVGWLLHIPLVFDFQGSLTSEMLDHRFLRPSNPLVRPLARVERWIARQPALILANSRHSASLLERQFGVNTERIRVVPDCVDTERFHPSVRDAVDDLRRLKEELGIPPSAALVVYLGLLAPYQGIDLLLESIRYLDPALNLHVLIMGFPNVDRYRKLAGDYGVAGRVTFTGTIPYHIAQRLLALGDVAVGPKISETEGSGKLLNYMAMGLPTLAFDTPVSREYLGEAGVLTPAGDIPAFSTALIQLVRDPEERSRRGNLLRARAVNLFDISVGLDAIESAYLTCCGQNGDRLT